MMFFSRFQINPQRREAKKLLANPRAMHAAVESCFPPPRQEPGEGRLLWRVDREAHDVRLYVVSPDRPEFRHLVEQAGWEQAPGETTDYGRFLQGLQKGQRFGFRLTANPVKRKFVHGSRGKVLPLVGEQACIEWLDRRAGGWGFALRRQQLPDEIVTERAPDFPAAHVIGREDRSFRKDAGGPGHVVTQRQVAMTGGLQVTDPGMLRAALVNGMGRGKAYGCGLMTLARGQVGP